MSKILYYSTYCDKCNKIMSELTRCSMQKECHFICIDQRRTQNDYIVVDMPDGEVVRLPPEVTCVPAMYVIKDNKFIFGNEIHELVGNDTKNKQAEASLGNLEPLAFSVDKYSNIDETESVAGMYASATYDNIDRIETPPEDYKSDKVDEDSLKQYQEMRNAY